MDVAYIVAGLVFAQAMEINIIVCDSSIDLRDREEYRRAVGAAARFSDGYTR